MPGMSERQPEKRTEQESTRLRLITSVAVGGFVCALSPLPIVITDMFLPHKGDGQLGMWLCLLLIILPLFGLVIGFIGGMVRHYTRQRFITALSPCVGIVVAITLLSLLSETNMWGWAGTSAAIGFAVAAVAWLWNPK
jgi:hypothetical protein